MPTHEKIEYKNGVTVVHFSNPIQDDYSLCGCDLGGDSLDENGAYENSNTVKEKVDCLNCIRIVQYCKKIRENEFKKVE